MNKIFYPVIIILLATAALYAQNPDPCTDKKAILLLMEGAKYTAKCDSIYVLSNIRYKEMRNKIIYNQALVKEYKSMTNKLDETNKERDNLNKRFKQHIAKQDSAIVKYEMFTTQADSLLTRSTVNTDRALEELRKTRFKMFIYSTVAAISGVTVGYLIGRVAD